MASLEVIPGSVGVHGVQLEADLFAEVTYALFVCCIRAQVEEGTGVQEFTRAPIFIG